MPTFGTLECDGSEPDDLKFTWEHSGQKKKIERNDEEFE